MFVFRCKSTDESLKSFEANFTFESDDNKNHRLPVDIDIGILRGNTKSK